MRANPPGSYWHETIGGEVASYPPLEGDVQTDVAIIGAGMTGLTAALDLKQAGKQVVVLEAGRIGTGTTGGTSGHLDVFPDQGLPELIDNFGEPTAKLVVDARRAAIDQIETWCRDFNIECEFQRVPVYSYTESHEGLGSLERECEAARRLGLDVSMVQEIPLPFPCAGGFRAENQARFHSLRYLHALAAQVHGDGSAVHEGTRAQPPQDGAPPTVRAGGKTVSAAAIVVATHSAYLGISSLDMRIAPYQSYVMTVRVDESVPDALFWDDAEPYHYTRWAAPGDPNLLMIGGADHKTGQGGDERGHFQQLEQYVRRRFSVRSMEQCWSAEFFEPADGLPFIGRVPRGKRVYVATGFSGTGLTYGTVAGRLVSDLILQRDAPLAEVFTPSRFSFRASAGELLSENLNVAKHFVADRFGGDRIASADELRPGEGRLVKLNGRQLAVYRDELGGVHALSPVCTHAGCIVHWNTAEKTWDCPCHGGRYSCLGERIYGPPMRDLKHEGLGGS